jgi:hypothetical protein
MSILIRFEPAEPVTIDQYDDVIRELEEGGDFPPDGLDYHVCFMVDGNVRVSEIWDSREKFDAFGERLMPLLSDAGINPGEPKELEIHNIIKR